MLHFENTFFLMVYRFFSSIIPVICLILGIASCSAGSQQSGIYETTNADTTLVEYAQGFKMEKSGDITLLTVSNPWQGAQNVSYCYVLCPKGTEVPAEYSHCMVIHTPVEKVICLSTTHVGMLSVLDHTSSIKALSGAAYVSDSVIRQAITEGKVVDIGYDQGLNYEKIISINPDVIFTYGVTGDVSGSMARLASLGQKIVFNAEYLERTPLGKAEWIKFMAAFYGNEQQAIEKFDSIKNDYLSHCRMVKNLKQQPKVICGLPWQGIWHIPGGNSWMAAIIADAGGDYIWKDNNSYESIPVNIETIINQGGVADYWINTGAARSVDEIRSVDERMSLIKPLRTGMVFNNYARVSVGGGNDFFESGVVYPHIILKDMIKIFHPDLLPDHHLHYYMKLD